MWQLKSVSCTDLFLSAPHLFLPPLSHLHSDQTGLAAFSICVITVFGFGFPLWLVKAVRGNWRSDSYKPYREQAAMQTALGWLYLRQVPGRRGRIGVVGRECGVEAWWGVGKGLCCVVFTPSYVRSSQVPTGVVSVGAVDSLEEGACAGAGGGVDHQTRHPIRMCSIGPAGVYCAHDVRGAVCEFQGGEAQRSAKKEEGEIEGGGGAWSKALCWRWRWR
jgi:hypothetical protein